MRNFLILHFAADDSCVSDALIVMFEKTAQRGELPAKFPDEFPDVMGYFFFHDEWFLFADDDFSYD